MWFKTSTKDLLMKLTLTILTLTTALAILPSCSTSRIAVSEKSDSTKNSQTLDDFETTKDLSTENSLAKSERLPDIEVPLVKPTVDLVAIKKLLQDYAPDFDGCYQEGLAKSPTPEDLKGHLLLKFKINTNGKVDNTDISSADFNSDEVINCIRKTLIEIPFPESNRTVAINQPINFNSVLK
jgi:hypothetical protein